MRDFLRSWADRFCYLTAASVSDQPTFGLRGVIAAALLGQPKHMLALEATITAFLIRSRSRFPCSRTQC
jgi:hypothetical protein